MQKDKIFFDKEPNKGSFEFSNEVVNVFPDMLRRSIPSYSRTIETIEFLTKEFIQPNTNCYDLGCSLGEASLSMLKGINVNGCQIYAIDKSESMTRKFKKNLEENSLTTPINILNDDILNIRIKNASIIVMNYTLQFLKEEDRQSMINKIFNGLNKGGLFLLSEKIKIQNNKVNDVLDQLHYNFKLKNKYSQLEISRKRDAIENVLIRDDLCTHQKRLERAGFKNFGIWMQHFNFASYIAIK
tara:strand:+ start:19075 stop:19800 length:726 start_codon:yes stop_codon:yes gene_type:complete